MRRRYLAMSEERTRRLLTVEDWRKAAKEKLDPMAYDYFAGGADAEWTLKRNEKAFGRHELYYRVLVDVASIDTKATVLGSDVDFPILVAPTAYQKLAHTEGEIATARGAADAGTLFTLSTLATSSIEEVAAASEGPKWFQLYVVGDRGLTKELVERASDSGYKAIVLTVDAPVFGRRLADERNDFALPEGMSLVNLGGYAEETTQFAGSGSALSAFGESRHDASLDWDDIEWLRSLTDLPLVIKGLVRADDAVKAADHGASGVVVSNHGGRQLDGTPATIDALGPVVDSVGDRVEVFMDSGVRWGSDVLKALAIGAKAVLVGRPPLWGLSVDGASGVSSVLNLLKDELTHAMALAGVVSLGDISRDLVLKR